MTTDLRERRVRLALDENPIVEVARALGKKPTILYEFECVCGKVAELCPRIDRFVCRHCGRKGDALALVRLLRGLDDEAALALLEERAGLDGSAER